MPKCHAVSAIPQLSASRPGCPCTRPSPHFPVAKGHTQTLTVQDLSPHCYREPSSVTLSPATTPAPRGQPPMSSQRCWAPHHKECVRSPHSTQLGPGSLLATCFLEPFYPPPAIGTAVLASPPHACGPGLSAPECFPPLCCPWGLDHPHPVPRASGLLPHCMAPVLRCIDRGDNGGMAQV